MACCGKGRKATSFTWMDAKVGDWVVTPRRGKAVEINALWYNALRLLSEWLAVDGDGEPAAAELHEHADRACAVVQRSASGTREAG